MALLMMMTAGTGDGIDVRVARKSKNYYHAWIGDHDKEFDMAVS
jgi:hypothetical protein